MSYVIEAKKVIEEEIVSLRRMYSLLGDSFEKSVEMIANKKGRLVVIGMGKSGIIGQKIVATMASTGTPAFSVHPGEAFHGDLGMIKPSDVVLLISNSGETEEVIRLIPFLKWQKNQTIALTGNINSTLAKHVDLVLDISVEKEACPNNLAPTSSTTNTLVMGDALAIALSIKKDFKPENFARFHPGGSLGRKLLTTVEDLMSKTVPICKKNDSFIEVLHGITNGRQGIVLVMKEKQLLGVISDGDVRRSFEKTESVKKLTAKDMMNKNPVLIKSDEKIVEAEKVFLENKVHSLIVVKENEVAGILNHLDI